ncbi:uncharacterized protein IL334_003796 [Kwoniella shivajii]|uniref:Major facilitator superfamily (MFS) profile domain-containing protein n=1 Tax=Kwoniella shivajii TaxID=564305 RepID=A0ABZ1CYJ7_9TREE|nr:hypothetical protein IL334_003796 [Kwoniella shivajii]
MSAIVDDKHDVQHVEDGNNSLKLDNVEPTYIPDTIEEKRLVRKIDRHLLPMLWSMYVFNYLDRTNIGNAKTGGMQKDLKLTSSQYSLVLSIFFVPAELSKRIALFYTASLVSGAFGGLLAGGIIQGLEVMTVPIYIVALIISVGCGWNADRTGQKAYHVLAACCWGVISFVICVTVHNNAVRYAFICFGGAGIWTGVPLFLSWMVTMFDGREKRAISIALINGVGNLSSVYGSFFWPASDAPQYKKGFAITSGLMGLAGVLVIITKWRYQDRGVAGIPKR